MARYGTMQVLVNVTIKVIATGNHAACEYIDLANVVPVVENVVVVYVIDSKRERARYRLKVAV